MAIELIALQPITGVEVAEGAGARIEAGDALVGAHPEEALIIAQHAVHHIVGQAFVRGEAGEGAAAHIQPVQAAAVGADPQHVQAVRRVRADGEDRGRGERGAVLRIVRVGLPGLRRGIHAQQAVHGARPHHAIGALVQGGGEGIGIVHHRHRPRVGRAGVRARVHAPEGTVPSAPQRAVRADVQREVEPAVAYARSDLGLQDAQRTGRGIVTGQCAVGHEGPQATIAVLHRHVRVLRGQLALERGPLPMRVPDLEGCGAPHGVEHRDEPVVERSQHPTFPGRGQRADARALPVVEPFVPRIVLDQPVARRADPEGAVPIQVRPLQGSQNLAHVRVRCAHERELALLRIEPVQALEGGEPQQAFAVHHRMERLQPAQLLRVLQEVLDRSGAGIHLHDPVLVDPVDDVAQGILHHRERTELHIGLGVFDPTDGIHHVRHGVPRADAEGDLVQVPPELPVACAAHGGVAMAEPGGGEGGHVVAGEGLGERELHQGGGGAHPQVAIVVEHDMHHTAPIAFGPTDGQVDEPFRALVEEVEPGGRSHPQAAVAVALQAGDVALAQAGGIGGIVPEHGEPVTVVPVQAILGAEPQEAMKVLCDGAHHALREPLIDGDPGEGQVDGVDQKGSFRRLCT